MRFETIGRTGAVALAILCAGTGSARGQPASGVDASAVSAVQLRIEAGRAAGAWHAAGRDVRALQAVPRFFEGRGFEPAWTAARGDERVGQLLAALRGARRHGLDPADYHLAALDSLTALWRAGRLDVGGRVDLELLATDAFLTLASHLLMGRVNPETIDPEWLANRRQAAFEDVLAEALGSGRIAATLEAQAPMQARYQRLADALARLRAAAATGGWPTVESGDKLEEGMSGPRVRQLRARLAASGDLPPERVASSTFDAGLADAVRRFQTRHGLEPDGVVGAGTIGTLNVGPAERARQVEVNLERWRWLPADLGARHIEVNIAGFDVKVVEGGRTVRTHRAIVGRQYRQTPVFSGTMTYLVLAPYWHVPPGIAAGDKLPAIKADPGYLAAQRMTLFDQATNAAVNPASVDWSSLTGREFNRRYRLRQEPGPQNALGSVKFMFPNRHNVYLHDTPARELFARANRSFSSGCIRTQNPLELATYLLADQPEWTRERIDRVVAAGIEQAVRLREPLSVHLLYWTAWADEEGTIHFRDDIYGRDATVRQALEAPAP